MSNDTNTTDMILNFRQSLKADDRIVALWLKSYEAHRLGFYTKLEAMAKADEFLRGTTLDEDEVERAIHAMNQGQAVLA